MTDIREILDRHGYTTSKEGNLYSAGKYSVIWDMPYKTPDTDFLAFSHLAGCIIDCEGERFDGEYGPIIVYDEQTGKFRYDD